MNISQAAEFLGVSRGAVQKAIKRGRLSRCVKRDSIGRADLDPEMLRQEWSAKASQLPAGLEAPRRAASIPVRTEAANDDDPEGDEQEEPVDGPLAHSLAADPVIHEGMSLADASAAEKVWRARLAELKYRRESGELTPTAEVEGELVRVFSACKTKLLGIPSRARQQDPGLTGEQLALFEGLIREALEELAGEAGEEEKTRDE